MNDRLSRPIVPSRQSANNANDDDALNEAEVAELVDGMWQRAYSDAVHDHRAAHTGRRSPDDLDARISSWRTYLDNMEAEMDSAIEARQRADAAREINSSTHTFDSPIGRVSVPVKSFVPFGILATKRPYLMERLNAYIANCTMFTGVLCMICATALMSLSIPNTTSSLAELSIITLCAFMIERSMIPERFAPLRWFLALLRPLTKNYLHFLAPICMAIWRHGDWSACLPVYAAYAICAVVRAIILNFGMRRSVLERGGISAALFAEYYSRKYRAEILSELHIIATHAGDPRRIGISAGEAAAIADVVVAKKKRAVSPVWSCLAVIALLYVLLYLASIALVHLSPVIVDAIAANSSAVAPPANIIVGKSKY